MKSQAGVTSRRSRSGLAEQWADPAAHTLCKTKGTLIGVPCVQTEEMVHPERFERPTYWFVASCSIQLSYGCTLLQLQLSKDRGFNPR